MKIGIASLECKVVKNAKQGAELLFIGAENFSNLICCLCQIRWSKTPRAFGNLVEGTMVDKFGIQTLVWFSFEFWSKFVLNRATLNLFLGLASRTHDVAPGHATSASPPYRWAHTPSGPVSTGPWQASAGTVCLRA
jgi:hypothetical protein